MDRIGEAAMLRHHIVCGDSATLQGNERDIVFLSMVADRHRKQAQTARQYRQRFNVALSRARDRMVLVRSVKEKELNPDDLKAKVIQHFRQPMPPVSNPNLDLIELCQSEFERAVFTALTGRGYRVTPQVGSQGFSIDMVVEGENGLRLAVECDGDRYHGPERWADDMRRQRILERVGWTFWRSFASTFYIDPGGTLEDLVATLDRMKIRPIGGEASSRLYTEHRVLSATEGTGEDKSSEAERSQAKGPRQMKLFDETAGSEQEFDGVLNPGDRVVIRYLDDERSRPELYILTDNVNDPKNGFLSISSPLARALADAAPEDEFIFALEDGRERTVLFMNLERERVRVA